MAANPYESPDKQSSAKWRVGRKTKVALSLALLPLLYAFSSGPAIKMVADGSMREDTYETVYAPLTFACHHTETTWAFGGWQLWWGGLRLRRGFPLPDPAL
jgi:hypothetical protein